MTMPEEAMTQTIRVIVFYDEGLWVAQCLEYDIGAQAQDVDTLMARFDVTMKAEIKESIARHGRPLAGIAPAPERFHRMWDHRVRSMLVSPPPWMISERPIDLALVA
jgi:hypothetical protein